MENMLNYHGSNVTSNNFKPGELLMFHNDVLSSRGKRANSDPDMRRIRDVRSFIDLFQLFTHNAKNF